jgi:pimeloyl-ACP methyl ester carboxylesterase
MIAQPGKIRYKDNYVHCLKMGQGPRLLIAFHGFGNDAGIFAPLAERLQDIYTTVSINLPGHGETDWHARYMKKEDLMAIVQGVRNDFGTEKFSLAGYSLGGRICLSIAELQPNWIDHLFLFASDGLQRNFWYEMATRNIIGKAVFKQMLEKPEQWLKRAALLKKWQLIDESRYKFARFKLTDPSVRKQLKYVWPVTSKLIAALPLVKWNIKKYKVDVLVFMGKHDRIFPVAQAERFVKGLKKAEMHVINTGHDLLQADYLDEIHQCIVHRINKP